MVQAWMSLWPYYKYAIPSLSSPNKRSEPEEWVKKWLERELDPSLMKKDSQQSDKQFGQGLLIWAQYWLGSSLLREFLGLQN